MTEETADFVAYCDVCKEVTEHTVASSNLSYCMKHPGALEEAQRELEQKFDEDMQKEYGSCGCKLKKVAIGYETIETCKWHKIIGLMRCHYCEAFPPSMFLVGVGTIIFVYCKDCDKAIWKFNVDPVIWEKLEDDDDE